MSASSRSTTDKGLVRYFWFSVDHAKSCNLLWFLRKVLKYVFSKLLMMVDERKYKRMMMMRNRGDRLL